MSIFDSVPLTSLTEVRVTIHQFGPSLNIVNSSTHDRELLRRPHGGNQFMIIKYTAFE